MAKLQSQFLHVRLRIRDVESTVKFYTEVLGFEEVKRTTSPAGNHLVFLRLPGNDTLLELCYSKEYTDFKIAEDLMHLAISVLDLHEFRKKWEPKGIQFWPEDGPVNDHFYFIDDPNGYEIEVIKAEK